MVRKTALAALCVGMSFAFGDAPKPGAPQRAKPKVIDLDFTENDEDRTDSPKSREGHDSRGRWLYWTLGAGVVAAGGVGWYFYQDEREPQATRNEQIFTDAR